jgi:hypothetical protein
MQLRVIVTILAAATLGLAAQADEVTPAPVVRDANAIKMQAGCFKVKFNYRETEQFIDKYPTVSAPYSEEAFEWVTIVDETPTKLSLQHILVGPNYVVKHWRQEWVFAPSMLIDFNGDLFWQMRRTSPQETAGRWAQVVYAGDDSPRFSCSAPWSYLGENPSWSCHSWAPLPRREYSQRADYNVLDRGMSIEVDQNSNIQSESNTKILLRDNQLTPIAREQGSNAYGRVDDSNCAGGKDWWTPQRQMIWQQVRMAWDQVLTQHPALKIVPDRNGKSLDSAISAKVEELNGRDRLPTPQEIQIQIRTLIESYLI